VQDTHPRTPKAGCAKGEVRYGGSKIRTPTRRISFVERERLVAAGAPAQAQGPLRDGAVFQIPFYYLKGAIHVQISLRDVVGQGYDEFWRFRGRYRVVKGSRASKKSKTAALWYIFHMMKYPGANTLVIRKTFRTLKDSCFTELKWAIGRLGVSAYWKVIESPLEMTYLPTGQKIYFRGLDDPFKVTSITVETGALCWMWIEEAYEITRETDFDIINESIRGAAPDGLFKQVTLTLNPWNERHWIKKRFFDGPPPPPAEAPPSKETPPGLRPPPSKEGGYERLCRNLDESSESPPLQRGKSRSDRGCDILAMTTCYTCNEWLDDADRRLFEEMRVKNPRRYRVAGLGEWGIAEGLIYENWEERSFSLDEVRRIPGVQSAFGLDFGYTNDPSALFCGMIDLAGKTIYVFDEMYRRGMSNEAIARAVSEAGYAKERICADSSEPKSIARLRELGLVRVRAARKGQDSVNHGIDFLQDFTLVIHPKCVNFLTEIANYTWDTDKFGARVNTPIDDFNHLMDAMRYATEEFVRPRAVEFLR